MIDAKELSDRLEGRICGGEMHKGGYIHVPIEEAEAINELLKAQEPVKPSRIGNMLKCGKCGAHVGIYGDDVIDSYCRKCGRRVQWDEEQKDPSW